jgi:methylated-DNA-[protein]-cysteine S-methyltransferase
MYYYTTYASPLGQMTLACAADGKNIVGAWLEGQEYFLGSLQTEQGRAKKLPVLEQACAWLDRYFAGQRPNPGELPLAPAGTEFRRKVWARLLRIPYGQVVTYGEIARELAAAGTSSPKSGRKSLAGTKKVAAKTAAGAKKTAVPTAAGKMSARAVGGAVGHNPISIIIPCHRVIGARGRLTGYAGGLDKKVALLKLEGVKLEGDGGKTGTGF